MKGVSPSASRVAQPASKEQTQTQTRGMKGQSRPLKRESRRQVAPLALMEPEKEKRTVEAVNEDSHLQPAVNPEATKTTTTYTWMRVDKTYRFPFQVEVPCMERNSPQPSLWKRNIQIEMSNLNAVAQGATRGVDVEGLLQRTPTPSLSTHPTSIQKVRWPAQTQASRPCQTSDRWAKEMPSPREVDTQTEREARTVATQVEVRSGCSWPEGLQRMQALGLPISGPRTEVQTVAAYAAAGWLSPGLPRPRLPGIGWAQKSEAQDQEPPQDPVELLGDAQVAQRVSQIALEENWEGGEDDLALEAAAEAAERSMTETGADNPEMMDLSGESGCGAPDQQS